MLGFTTNPDFGEQVAKEEFFLMSLYHLQPKKFRQEATQYLAGYFVEEMMNGQINMDSDEFLSAICEIANFRAEKHFD